MSRLFVLFIGLLIFTSCSNSKRITKSTTNKEIREIVSSVNKNQIRWKWFGTRSRVVYNDGSNKIGFSSTIRLKKDETIWISASKLGIELARIMITPDSVFMMNRWEKEYAIKSFDELAEYTSVPVSFIDLQDIVFGNPVQFGNGEQELDLLSEKYLVTNENELLKNMYWFSAGDLLLDNMQMINKGEEQEVFVSLNDYRSVSQKQLAHQRDVHFKGDKSINIELEYSRIKVNEPLEFPFNIPSTYKRIN